MSDTTYNLLCLKSHMGKVPMKKRPYKLEEFYLPKRLVYWVGSLGRLVFYHNLFEGRTSQAYKPHFSKKPP